VKCFKAYVVFDVMEWDVVGGIELLYPKDRERDKLIP
jgi:hypothetical protein